MISATEALGRLEDGNSRFVNSDGSAPSPTHKPNMTAGQDPFAIVLACSDSRVPTELIFDQGVGDLFVIRVAGNVVAPSQIGSVEFAATMFGTRLVVVLGHSHCGAVTATIEELAKNHELRSPNLRAIVDRIRPAIESLVEESQGASSHELLTAAIRANVTTSVHQLEHGSSIIESLIDSGDLTIVGAEYSIEDGKVRFLSDRG